MNITDLLKRYRLSDEEYEKMKILLQHEPNNIEWAVFSALWSEHCSYKSSKIHLKKFSATKTPFVFTEEGENAGAIKLPTGEKIVFKMESHNHPSFIEPFQGAATGVGGILRDIFTMGARPIALANYLCFGNENSDKMNYLFKNVVRGISHYGNCVGVPMITGRTQFDDAYNQNILVNAFALGYLTQDQRMALSVAQGVGNYVVYVGARTGPDGVHGAAMASESFGEDLASKRPNIQIGDPFLEKLLIESCMEVIHNDLVVAIQDMGAAGLTSSSFEMAAKGNVGFEIDLSKVPTRGSQMEPEDILLSESQERMLLICKPDKFEAIKGIFTKYSLESEVIGKVIDGNTVRILWEEEVLADIPAKHLVDNAPIYSRDYKSDKTRSYNAYTINKKDSYKEIYQQFDQRVGVKTIYDCSWDMGLIRLPESGASVAVALGGRSDILKRSVKIGAIDSIIWPSIKMALRGVQPLGATDCLNYGNPEKPEIMNEFVESIDYITKTCEAISVAVVSGNVSFYNETGPVNIIPTPAVGVVGYRKDTNVPLKKEMDFPYTAKIRIGDLSIKHDSDLILGNQIETDEWAKILKGIIDLYDLYLPDGVFVYDLFDQKQINTMYLYLFEVGFSEFSKMKSYINGIKQISDFFVVLEERGLD